VALAENDLFVGANGSDGGKGSIFLFSRTTDGWLHSANLSADDLSGRAGLGSSLAFSNTAQTLYAGSPGQSGGGAVHMYERDNSGEWKHGGFIAQPEPATADERLKAGLGSGIAVSDGTLLIGARNAAFYFSGSLVAIPQPVERRGAFFGTGLALRNGVALIGSPSADYEEGVTDVFEYSSTGDGAEMNWTFQSTLASEIAFMSSITGDQVNCEEGSAQGFECSNVDMISFMSASELTSHRGVKMTDIWGWEDPVTGKEWVLQARTDGTAFVDISNPSKPLYVGQLYRTEGSPGSSWRDVKVYKDHAYIVADGADQHGVQIFDLTQLRDVDPAAMPVTFEETAHYAGTASTHNVVINEETGFAYAVGNRSGGENMCGGQLHIFDIREPAEPKFAGCFSEGQGGTHDAQCVVYRGADAEYAGAEVCFASNGSSFVIANVSDKDSTVTIANTSYPNQAYTHQGWLTEDQNYFFMNDELDEMNGSVEQTRTLIWDVSDLDDPQLVKEFYLDSGASDHNLYIRDNLMYQSNYQAGLRIIDISDPENPVEVGHFDTTPYAGDEAGFGGSWSNYPYFKSGVIAVSSRSEGLFILKKKSVDL
ncbi:MAG: choice-of-anchor B family protein, partial [Rhodothermales bacterium]|nr:choice-of-anchor B family protein [Rhodothermales bacterium]